MAMRGPQEVTIRSLAKFEGALDDDDGDDDEEGSLCERRRRESRFRNSERPVVWGLVRPTSVSRARRTRRRMRARERERARRVRRPLRVSRRGRRRERVACRVLLLDLCLWFFGRVNELYAATPPPQWGFGEARRRERPRGPRRRRRRRGRARCRRARVASRRACGPFFRVVCLVSDPRGDLEAVSGKDSNTSRTCVLESHRTGPASRESELSLDDSDSSILKWRCFGASGARARGASCA